MTTHSTSSSSAFYISRAEAAATFEGTPEDVFQGDLFSDVEIFVPKLGTTPQVERMPVIVASHDCEWTKVQGRGPEYPLHVVPLRRVEAFKSTGQDGLIRQGRIRYLFYLPADGPVATEFAADLRLTQPLSAGELTLDNYIASMGPLPKKALQGALTVFFTDRRPRSQ